MAEAVEKKKIPTNTQVFKWDFEATKKQDLEWKEDLELTVAQIGVYKPKEYTVDPKPTSYIAITETRRDARWEVRSDKALTIIGIVGTFDADGHFAVSKVNYLKDNPKKGFKGWCTIKLKLKNSAGAVIKLKDADGKAADGIALVLPAMDLNDDAWTLDVMFAMPGYRERKQDQIWVKGDLEPLLDGKTKYESVPFEGTQEKYRAWYSSRSRRSYKKLIIHCSSAKREYTSSGSNATKSLGLDKWFDFEKIAAIYSHDNVGAQFVIDRDGRIRHCTRTFRRCNHAGDINLDSIGIELVGLVDELSVSMLLCWGICRLATKPLATSAGSLSSSAKNALKQAAAYTCVKIVGGVASVRASSLARMKKMIDAMADKYKDADFADLTSVPVPTKRQNWRGDVGRPWKEFDSFDKAMRLLYFRAFAAGFEGKSVKLKVANVGRVEVTKGECKCTIEGANLDAKQTGVTLARMAKGDKYPGKVDDKGTWVTVPKEDCTKFLTDRLDTAIAAKSSGGAVGAEDVTVKVLLEKKTKVELETAMIGYTDEQYSALADLTQALYRLYRFKGVASHHKLNKNGKRDPGVFFDWDEYIGHKHLAEVRAESGLEWDPADADRKPKGFAERENKGLWGK